jgi:hypothetical protein
MNLLGKIYDFSGSKALPGPTDKYRKSKGIGSVEDVAKGGTGN